MSVETDEDGETEGATVQDSQDSTRLAGCNSVRGTGVLHQRRMAQKGVQRCEMRGVVAVAQRSEREHLSTTKGVFSLVGVSTLTEMSELGDQLLTSQ